MVAKNPSPTPTSRNPHEAPYEATRQANGPSSKEARIAPAVLVPVLKGTGVALLVIAVLLAVYLGADLLGEWAVRATYP